jgi:hypothetical protein
VLWVSHAILMAALQASSSSTVMLPPQPRVVAEVSHHCAHTITSGAVGHQEE